MNGLFALSCLSLALLLALKWLAHRYAPESWLARTLDRNLSFQLEGPTEDVQESTRS